ncbi:hypothetical protein CEXT_350281 [Caerostris extrusa]|uniref:Uncharacterized protein n=1 Tax=Caerostris extrusa TaxID=172846 RepID=A0AAV4Y4E6_CAEEX|nr:hypothetical protein CEXT_350281 [Caerostris extrusa]
MKKIINNCKIRQKNADSSFFRNRVEIRFKVYLGYTIRVGSCWVVIRSDTNHYWSEADSHLKYWLVAQGKNRLIDDRLVFQNFYISAFVSRDIPTY